MEINSYTYTSTQYQKNAAKNKLVEAEQLHNQASSMKDRADAQEKKAVNVERKGKESLQNIKLQRLESVSVELSRKTGVKNRFHDKKDCITDLSGAMAVIKSIKTVSENIDSIIVNTPNNQSAKNVLHLLR